MTTTSSHPTASKQLAALDAHRVTVDTARGEVSCIDVGPRDGTTAVFVHGVGTNAHLWRHVHRRARRARSAASRSTSRCTGTARRPRTTTSRSVPTPRPWLRSSTGWTSARSTWSPTTPAAPSRRSSPRISPNGCARSRSRTATLTTTCRPRRSSPTVELARAGAACGDARRRCSPTSTRRAPRCSRWATRTRRSRRSRSCATSSSRCSGRRSGPRPFERLIAGDGARRPARGGARAAEAGRADARRLGHRRRVLRACGGRSGCATRSRASPRSSRSTGAKLFFPDERAAELVPHLRRHWASADGQAV